MYLLLGFNSFFKEFQGPRKKCQTQSNGAAPQHSQTRSVAATSQRPARRSLPHSQDTASPSPAWACSALPSPKELWEEPAARATLRQGLSSHDVTLARDCRGGPEHSAYLQQALTCSATLINSPFSCDYSQCSLAAPSKYTSNVYFSMRLLLLHCKTSPDERQCCSAAKDGRASSSVYVWGVWSVH